MTTKSRLKQHVQRFFLMVTKSCCGSWVGF